MIFSLLMHCGALGGELKGELGGRLVEETTCDIPTQSKAPRTTISLLPRQISFCPVYVRMRVKSGSAALGG